METIKQPIMNIMMTWSVNEEENIRIEVRITVRTTTARLHQLVFISSSSSARLHQLALTLIKVIIVIDPQAAC